MEVDKTYGGLETPQANTNQPTQTTNSSQTDFSIATTNTNPEWKKPTKIKVVVTVE